MSPLGVMNFLLKVQEVLDDSLDGETETPDLGMLYFMDFLLDEE